MAKEIVFKINVQGSKDVLDLERQIKQLKKEIKESTDDNVATKLTKDLDILSVKLKEARNQARIAQADLTAKDTTIGSYARLSAQLVLARERFKELAANSGSSAKQIEAARLEAARLDSQLKKIDSSTGVFGRNVGNYAGSLKGLFGQLKGALQSTLLVGNIRNLPQLFNLAKGAIDGAAQAVDTYKSATDSAYVITKKTSEATEGLIKEFVSEKSKLNDLKDVAQDENATKEDRLLAVEALKKQFPSYFENLTLENATTGELAKGYAAATQALKDNLKAKIKAQIIEAQIVDAVKARIEADKEAKKAEAFSQLQTGDFTSFLNAQLANLNSTISETTANTSKAAAQSGGVIDKILNEVVDTAEGIVDQVKGATDTSTAGLKKLAGESDATSKKLSADRKKAADEEQKEREKRLKQIADYAKSELDFKLNTVKEVTKLQDDLAQSIVNNIEDEGQKVLAQELLNFNLRKAEREAQQAELVKLFAAQEAKLLEVYKEGSDQVIAFRSETAIQLTNINNQFVAIAQQAEIEHQAKLTDISSKAQEKRTQDEKDELNKRLAQNSEYLNELESLLELELLKTQEQLAKKTISIEQADQKDFEAKKKSILERLEIVKNTLALETELSDQQRRELTLQAQQLNTDLAQLEGEQTEKVVTESAKRKEARLAAVDSALNDASSIISSVQGVFDQVAEGDQARFQKQLDYRNKNISDLQEKLKTATGLEAEFLTNKIAKEQAAADKVEEQQKKARKRAAIANKTFAIAQAVINAALSITALNAAIIDPTPFQGFRIAALAITAGVNIAAIAAIAAAPLKFAKGGFTGSGSGVADNTGFKQAGIVHEGEYVIPKRIVNNKAFSSTIQGLEAARTGASVPNFTPRSIQTNQQGNEMAALVLQTNQLAQITAGKLNSLEVIFTTNTQAAIDNDRKEVLFNQKGTRL